MSRRARSTVLAAGTQLEVIGVKEYKAKSTLSRGDIASRLRRIADGLEQGSMSAGDVRVTVPDQAEFELELEQDELEIKIEWR